MGGFAFGDVVSKMSNLSTSDHSSVVSVNLFVALLCACIVVGHLLEESRWMNESITALAIVSFSLVISIKKCVCTCASVLHSYLLYV